MIAWLWARTVKSPNPAYSDVDVPLASTFILSSKAGKEAYAQPLVGKAGYAFTVKVGKPPDEAKAGTKSGRGNFRCVMSASPIDATYIRTEGKEGRLGYRLMAIVTAGPSGRLYLSPHHTHEKLASTATSEWSPKIAFFQQALGFRIGNYGLTQWCDVFTQRQLIALTTFADLVTQAASAVKADGLVARDCAPSPLRSGNSRYSMIMQMRWRCTLDFL